MAIAGVLKENGYLIANDSGIRIEAPESDHVGILKPREPEGRYVTVFPLDSIAGWPTGTFFPFIIQGETNPQAFHVGDVYIYPGEVQQWSLQLYGKEHAEDLKGILGQLATQNGATLDAILVNEKPKQEIIA